MVHLELQLFFLPRHDISLVFDRGPKLRFSSSHGWFFELVPRIAFISSLQFPLFVGAEQYMADYYNLVWEMFLSAN